MWRQAVADVKVAPERAGVVRDVDARERREVRANPINYSGYERDRFFLNVSDGRSFRELGYSVGLDFDTDGRATVPFDYDGDGDLDLALLSLQRLQLLENLSSGGHFVRFTLEAKGGASHALGAVVRVTAGGRTQIDFVRATTGFSSAVPLDVHFGLGDAERIEKVVVEWPDGTRQEFEDVAGDTRWGIERGEARLSETPLERWDARYEDVRPVAVVELPTELPLLAGGEAALPTGGPTIVNIWASWCAPCREELPELARLAAARSDVNVILVNVDEDVEAARSFASQHRIELPIYRHTEALFEALFASGDKASIALPTTLVFDAQKRQRRAFSRATTAAERQEALTAIEPIGLERGDGELLALSGLYQLQMERPQDAVPVLERAVALDPEHVSALVNLATAYGQLERHADAERLLLRALELEPEHAGAQTNLGTIFFVQERHAAAIQALERAVEMDPAQMSAQYYLAAALASSGRRDEALRRVEAWLSRNPGDERFETLRRSLKP